MLGSIRIRFRLVCTYKANSPQKIKVIVRLCYLTTQCQKGQKDIFVLCTCFDDVTYSTVNRAQNDVFDKNITSNVPPDNGQKMGDLKFFGKHVMIEVVSPLAKNKHEGLIQKILTLIRSWKNFVSTLPKNIFPLFLTFEC